MMTVATEIRVPDRFERLRDSDSNTLSAIVRPVEPSLDAIDERFADFEAAGRGGLIVVKGTSGAGKSTFLDTVHLFRHAIHTVRIPNTDDLITALSGLEETDESRIVVLEGREAVGEVTDEVLESYLHAINSFVRTDSGRRTLVAWPVNKNDLSQRLVNLAKELGGDALLGLDGGLMEFSGPPPEEFVDIAERTVSALNEGASLAALGISEDRARNIAHDRPGQTIGTYLSRLRGELVRNESRVKKLLKKEQVRLWILVASGNDTEGDVAALTRGGFAAADIDRLMASTQANVVSDLKAQPDRIGMLGTILDARIFHFDKVAASAISRHYGGSQLHSAMQAKGMQTTRDSSAIRRIQESEIGLILSGQGLSTRKRGSKAGSNTNTAFTSLAEIARTNDGLLNRAIGEALVASGLASSFVAESKLTGNTTYTSDLQVESALGPVRIEVMWRTKNSRAEIANYTLGKVRNYGKCIGYLT